MYVIWWEGRIDQGLVMNVFYHREVDVVLPAVLQSRIPGFHF